MKSQKRIALINDITGFGRCSIAVQQPIISAMKIQACVMPTAILSTHTKFPQYQLYDFTANMESYMDNWQFNNIEFDSICTGFLGSEAQINHVISFFKKFKKETTFIVIDPVMGDNGHLYNSYTEKMCEQIKNIIPYADLITPNLTEACKLTNTDYEAFNPTLENLKDLCHKLSLMGPQKVVITGIEKENKILNCAYENNQLKIKTTKKIGDYRTGTGDIFTAIVAASIINNPNRSLYKAVNKAVNFINISLRYTNQLELPPNYGVCFEEFLKSL